MDDAVGLGLAVQCPPNPYVQSFGVPMMLFSNDSWRTTPMSTDLSMKETETWERPQGQLR